MITEFKFWVNYPFPWCCAEHLFTWLMLYAIKAIFKHQRQLVVLHFNLHTQLGFTALITWGAYPYIHRKRDHARTFSKGVDGTFRDWLRTSAITCSLFWYV